MLFLFTLKKNSSPVDLLQPNMFQAYVYKSKIPKFYFSQTSQNLVFPSTGTQAIMGKAKTKHKIGWKVFSYSIYPNNHETN